nr:unnamed protein product [Spirometra erinaceieuropaei]
MPIPLAPICLRSDNQNSPRTLHSKYACMRPHETWRFLYYTQPLLPGSGGRAFDAAGADGALALQQQQQPRSTNLGHLDITWRSSMAAPFIWTGVTHRRLSPLASGDSLLLPIDLLPVRPGLQELTGLHLKEVSTERAFNFYDLGHILVTPTTA